MKSKLSIVLISSLIIGACGCSRTAEQPNLLFVFTDQQSYDMLGVAGNSQVLTPNLDQLAGEGIYFRHAISNCPICSPYRGMLMSGQHPLYNGCFTNDVPLLHDNGLTFGQALGQAGYETAYVGKWHLFGGGTRDQGIPPGKNRHGFDGTFLTDNCTVDFRPGSGFYWNDEGEKVYFKDEYDDNPWELEGQTRQAESWLENYDEDKPFAMFVSWHPPHNYAFKGVEDPCPGVQMRKPLYDVGVLDSSVIEPYEGMDIKLRPGFEDPADLEACRKEMYRNYMAMVTACDHSVGRLIEKLKEKGVYENTLVVFTSDHGDMLTSFDSKKPKQYPQDYSLRVPLIMRWEKGLKKHRKSDLLVGAMDLMPTILGLLGIDIPEKVQGKDLSGPILSGDDDAVESVPLFMFIGNGWRGVYTREWTYANSLNPEESIHEGVETNVLFNRPNDPSQLNNLFDSEDYSGIQEGLAGLTHDWMDQFGDEGYALEDFAKIYQDGFDWWKNYTQRPIDVLKGKSKPQNLK
jgi:arylsulfatase A-like enzyme